MSLWVISGHATNPVQYPLYPGKQSFAGDGSRPRATTSYKSTDGNGILVHSSYILNLATRFVLIESLSLGA
jgi:hypothetical protein